MARKKQSARKGVRARQAHARVKSLLAGKAFTGKAGAAFIADVLPFAVPAPAAVKPVTFTCSNATALVSITSGSIHFVFSGTGGHNFPVGENSLFYGVQGSPNQSFSVTAQGGTLDVPISGTLTAQGKAGGARKLTVPA